MMSAIWFGRDKPDSDLIFSLPAQDMKQLDRGIPATDPQGCQYTLKARLLSFCLDLPAKAALFLMMQHGGHCACSFILLRRE